MKITIQMRGRPVTAAEATESVQRLINSHFHNENRARCQIPVSPQDDDIVASDYVQESADRIADLTAERDELRAQVERLTGPFTYSECESSHELPISEAKDAVDHLIETVDNANRYLARRVNIERGIAPTPPEQASPAQPKEGL